MGGAEEIRWDCMGREMVRWGWKVREDERWGERWCGCLAYDIDDTGELP